MIVFLTNVRWFRQGTDYHCHCEPARTLVWQSVSLCYVLFPYLSQKRERIATSLRSSQ